MKKRLTLLALFSACCLSASDMKQPATEQVEQEDKKEEIKVSFFKKCFNNCVKSPTASIKNHPVRSAIAALVLAAASSFGYEKYLEYKEAKELEAELNEDLDALADEVKDSK